MKTTITYLKLRMEKLMLWAVMLFSSVLTFAQDAEPVDVNVTTTKTTTTTSEEWISNPLYWVIGALFLIILIAIIARGNKR